MSDILGIGASGLKAYSRALATVGDNIANAQTPGYARRTLALRETVAGGDTVLTRGHVRPGGVEIGGVVRATDQWLVEEARLASSDSDRAGVRSAALQNVESALADRDNGIASALTSLFNTTDELTTDPTSEPLRNAFLQSAGDIANGFRQVAARLSRLADGNSVAAMAEVSAANTDLATLEKVNIGLRKARPGSTNEAQLHDERDRLLNNLASRLDISVTVGNRGTVTVRAASGGDLLVGGGVVNPIAVTAAADKRLSYQVGGAPLQISNGSLAGHAEAANHIADQNAAVDAAASSIAGTLNAAHEAGLDASGAPGTALFSGTGSAATLTATPLTVGQVAAARAGSENGNMLALGQLRGAGAPEATWGALLAQQSQQTAGARAQGSAAATRHDSAQAARDAIGEVDLDREAADLLRFQQAYTAAAQTIQVARETMQALFNAI